MTGYVIGVDGGNSKTEVLVVSVTGELLTRVRGAGVGSPRADPAAWRAHLHDLVAAARREAGLAAVRPSSAVFLLANLDLPDERRLAARELAPLAEDTFVHNDTLAVLYAGATRPWGVAVVAGVGINAIGVRADGRTAGFLAFGFHSGDIGGGHWLGLHALGAAVRADDGRGPATLLSRAVPSHFGHRRAADVAVAIELGRLPVTAVAALTPVLAGAAADGDPVAVRLIEDFGDEVAAMAGALLRRLRLVRSDAEVVLGGSVLQNGDERLYERIRQGIAAVAPAASVRVLDLPPASGAAIEALRRAGAGEPARAALRAELMRASDSA
ncbi:N-acetylglucosamine kinase [Actinoplanes sp. NPDC049599]|uniref:N-acetylglucosamine kinase n=1 Tax=Actinoplanes sp. NPDC049599 TaxID=3363903 RepID=UPI003787671E